MLHGFELHDQTEPRIGQDVRVIAQLRNRIRLGEILRIIGNAREADCIALQKTGRSVAFVQLPKDELRDRVLFANLNDSL